MQDEPKKHAHDVEYEEGQDAALAGRPVTNNPYEPGTPEFNRWQSGYLDAAEELF